MKSQASESSGDWVHLGEAIRHGRRRAGMTQEELATAAAVDRKTIGNYERGRVPASAPRVPDGYFAVFSTLKWAANDARRLLDGSPRDMVLKERRALQSNLRRLLDSDPSKEAFYDEHIATLKSRLGLLEWELGQSDSVAEPAAAGLSSLEVDDLATRHRELGLRYPPAPPSPDEPLALFPAVVRFGRVCVALGAHPALRGALEDAAQALLQQATAQPDALRDGLGLAAYRPHGWAEGDPAVPVDDADRIRKAVEEHKRNR